LRVSTTKQTVENQLPDCQRVAEMRGYDVVEVYREQESAAKVRPEFQRMQADAKRGRFKVLIIWALDRFGRTFMSNILDVKELDRLGVATVSVRDSWLDTSSGLARDILLGVFSAMAEHERARLRERVLAGLDRARKDGKTLGRPKSSPVLLHAAAALVALGTPVAESARSKGISRGALRRFLAENPSLAGAKTSPLLGAADLAEQAG
jgi:DNA invertase Pin-like site-specific DNA recombinase